MDTLDMSIALVAFFRKRELVRRLLNTARENRVFAPVLLDYARQVAKGCRRISRGIAGNTIQINLEKQWEHYDGQSAAEAAAKRSDAHYVSGQCVENAVWSQN